MKRLLSVALCLMIYSVSVSPALACRRHRTSHARYGYARQSRYRRVASNRSYYSYAPRRSFWQKHRDKLTLAMGTAGGMGVGALIGGRRGAGIGALAGLGSSALYTYKLRNRRRY